MLLAESCPLPYVEMVLKEDGDQEKLYRVDYGFRRVRLPGRAEELFLLAARGVGAEPVMLLTNVRITKKREVLWWVVEAYLSGWRVEETIRFIKQSYNLEDFRVRSYIGIRNMVVLVLAGSYFAAVYLGQNLKLKILVERIFLVPKRFLGVPSFFNYAIADGLYNLLFPEKRGLKIKTDKTEDFQLCLSFW